MNPHELAVLRRIAQGPTSTKEAHAAAAVSHAQSCRALRWLRTAGLVTTERIGGTYEITEKGRAELDA